MLYVNNPSLSQMYHSTSKHPLLSKRNTCYVHIHTYARLELQILKATKEQPAIINGALRTAFVLCPLYLTLSHPLLYKYEQNSKTSTEVK
jgi:hypothetical protein